MVLPVCANWSTNEYCEVDIYCEELEQYFWNFRHLSFVIMFKLFSTCWLCCVSYPIWISPQTVLLQRKCMCGRWRGEGIVYSCKSVCSISGRLCGRRWSGGGATATYARGPSSNLSHGGRADSQPARRHGLGSALCCGAASDGISSGTAAIANLANSRYDQVKYSLAVIV